MKIETDILLAPLTTFRIGGPAKYFCRVKREEDIIEAFDFARKNKLKTFILGGGSNLLVSDNGFSGLIIKIEIEDKPKIERAIDENIEIVSIGAGFEWDNFVEWSVDRGYIGLENLSAIPGKVGSAPVQNIGAYGAQVSDFIEKIRVFDTVNNDFAYLGKDECGFEYRDSIFKREKGKYIISKVYFKLSKKNRINIEYKDLREYLEQKNMNGNIDSVISVKSKDIRDAVICIRKAKLPDWTRWGTAGSFFKNPIVSADKFANIKSKFPDIVYWNNNKDSYKISLAWIIDKVCKLKGIEMGKAKIFENQAMVIVASHGASSTEVKKLSEYIMKCVKEKTDLNIEAEVEWVN